MKTDEAPATRMPNTIGIAKLETALPPQIAIGTSARKAVALVYRLRARVSLIDLSMISRNGIDL